MSKNKTPKNDPKPTRTVEETSPSPASGPPLRNRPVNLPHDLVRGDREPK